MKRIHIFQMIIFLFLGCTNFKSKEFEIDWNTGKIPISDSSFQITYLEVTRTGPDTIIFWNNPQQLFYDEINLYTMADTSIDTSRFYFNEKYFIYLYGIDIKTKLKHYSFNVGIKRTNERLHLYTGR